MDNVWMAQWRYSAGAGKWDNIHSCLQNPRHEVTAWGREYAGDD